MALIRWAPFDPVDSGFDALVRRAFGDFGSSLLGQDAAGWTPALDARMENEELHVRLELPGIDPNSDVDIEVNNGVLSVSGERRHEEAKEGDGWYRREIRTGRFERRIALPEGADAENIRASYDAGILDVAVPVPQKAKTRVKVEVGTQKQLKE
jgi:HSP20 family protein